MHYIIGIALAEQTDEQVLVSAVTCFKETPRRFGHGRLSANTVKREAICWVSMIAPNYVRGISAAYHRSIEKILLRNDFRIPPSGLDATALILRPYASNKLQVPHKLQSAHWTITAAEELLLEVL
jgi:hypothetical protein